MWKMVIWPVLTVVVLALAYVRLAPSDPSVWNGASSVPGTESRQLDGGYVWRKVMDSDATAVLEKLKAAAEATPRTVLLTGSVEAGQMTYVTRSKVIGFPDYTTISLRQTPEGQPFVEVYARLRFGKSDLGVNAKRVKSWVGTIE
jgi:uncharacterized protein (DUF1499 family)